MNETPTLPELRAAGYKVDIAHRRAYKIAYKYPTNGKIVVHTIYHEKAFMSSCSDADNKMGLLAELLPTGGKTEVTVFDPESGLDFYGTATCSDKENYSKRIGVNRCLSRILDLMRVCEYQDSSNPQKEKKFKIRV